MLYKKSRQSSNVKVKGHRSRSSGTKKRKSAAFFGSGPRGRSPHRRWENQRMLSSCITTDKGKVIHCVSKNGQNGSQNGQSHFLI